MIPVKGWRKFTFSCAFLKTPGINQQALATDLKVLSEHYARDLHVHEIESFIFLKTFWFDAHLIPLLVQIPTMSKFGYIWNHIGSRKLHRRLYNCYSQNCEYREEFLSFKTFYLSTYHPFWKAKVLHLIMGT